VGGYPGKRKPLRRAARFQGFVPVDLEHPDQLAESVAEIASAHKEIGRDVKEPFDVVAALGADELVDGGGEFRRVGAR
jgi:hypothetical protein